MAYIVKQPTKTGRIYVHLAENKYRKELRQARQSRQHLGVLDSQTGELLLSSKREGLSPDIIELLNKAGIRFAGHHAPPPGRARASKPSSKSLEMPAAVEDVGEAHAMLHLCREYGLEKSLSMFGQDDASALIYLAIWQACTGAPQYLAESWLQTRALPDPIKSADFSSPALSLMMRRIGQSRSLQERFFSAWIEACGYPGAIVYDTTSLSTYSARLEDAEWGYNRDHEKLPQVNLALATDGRTGLPLAFRLLPGSISDVKTLVVTSAFLHEYGLKKFTYSLDRGFYSAANVRKLLEDGISFVMGVPMTNKQSVALAEEAATECKSSSRSMLFGDQVLRQTERPWTVDMGGDKPSKLIQSFAFLDQHRAAAHMLALEKSLIELEQMGTLETFRTPDEAAKWCEENCRNLAKYYLVDIQSSPAVFRNPEAIDAAQATAGIALYIAHAGGENKFAAQHIIKVVRGRDIIEKFFDVCKNDNDQNRLRTGDGDIAQGRIFLAFLAAAIRTMFELRLRMAKINKSLTVDEALARLRKVKAVHFESGRRVLLEIPKKTRELFDALNIPIPS